MLPFFALFRLVSGQRRRGYRQRASHGTTKIFQDEHIVSTLVEGLCLAHSAHDDSENLRPFQPDCRRAWGAHMRNHISVARLLGRRRDKPDISSNARTRNRPRQTMSRSGVAEGARLRGPDRSRVHSLPLARRQPAKRHDSYRLASLVSVRRIRNAICPEKSRPTPFRMATALPTSLTSLLTRGGLLHGGLASGPAKTDVMASTRSPIAPPHSHA